MLPFSEACERNRGPILDVLQRAFARQSEVLEIGSGTGQHAVHFASNLTHLTWHPTERVANLAALQARLRFEAPANVRPATVLDVTQKEWPVRHVDAVFSANTLHIMSWREVMALFAGIDAVLMRAASCASTDHFATKDGTRRRATSASMRNFASAIPPQAYASSMR